MFGIWHRTSSYPDLGAVEPEPLRVLLETWRRAAGDGAIPRAQDLPVEALKGVLPHMALVALGLPVERPRYLVFGTALRSLLGRDPTGQAVEAVYPPGIVREVLAAFRKVVRERRPLFYKREFRILGHSFGYFRLMLPLGDATGRITHVVLGIVPTTADLHRAEQWQSAVEALKLRQAEAAAKDWAAALGEPKGLAAALEDERVWLV